MALNGTKTVALCMIVRDGAALLRECLRSVRGAVDEIVVGDTGSEDDSIAIAKEEGARVLSVPWKDDFAAARNQVLAEIKCEWVLVLDADERLDDEGKAEIPGLLEEQTVAGYRVTIRNYVLSLEDRIWDRPAKPNDGGLACAKSYPAYVEHENVRLFRKDPGICFVGRVHESVGPRIEQTGRKLGRAEFRIHHFGLVADAETRARKNHFYRRLGRKKLREMPRNAQAHLEMGLVELDNFGNRTEALRLFARACELNPGFGVAWFFRGVTLCKLQRHEEALKCLDQAERQGHCTPLVYETQADAWYNLRDYGNACKGYDRAYRGAGNPLLQSKLGLAIARAGNVERGLALIREAVEAKPDAAELHDRLMLSLVWLDRIEEAGRAGEAKIEAVGDPQAGDYLRAASLWARAKSWERAGLVLQAGLMAYPSDISLGRSLAEVLQALAETESRATSHAVPSGS